MKSGYTVNGKECATYRGACDIATAEYIKNRPAADDDFPPFVVFVDFDGEHVACAGPLGIEQIPQSEPERTV